MNALVPEIQRQCGDCTVCCEHVSIAETNSPVGQLCQHRDHEGCVLYGKPDRPAVCSAFHCAWIRGCGPEGGRPDKVGVMLSVNATPTGLFGFALEFRSDAIRTTGREMVITFVRQVSFPLIVRAAETPPPDDTGDYVIVHQRYFHRCSHIAGAFRYSLAPDVGVFELIKQRAA